MNKIELAHKRIRDNLKLKAQLFNQGFLPDHPAIKSIDEVIDQVSQELANLSD